jgi:hypothetical protein
MYPGVRRTTPRPSRRAAPRTPSGPKRELNAYDHTSKNTNKNDSINMGATKLKNQILSATKDLSDLAYDIEGGYEVDIANFTRLDVEIVRTAMHNVLYAVERSRYPVEVCSKDIRVMKDGRVSCNFKKTKLELGRHWLLSKNLDEIARMMRLHCEPTFLNTHTNDFSVMRTFHPVYLSDFEEACCSAGTYEDLHVLLDQIPTMPATDRTPTGLFSKMFGKKC